MDEKEWIISGLVAITYIVAVFVAYRILLENRNPLKTQSYLLLLIFLPVVGLLVYLYFGRDVFKRRRMIRKKLRRRLRSEPRVQKLLDGFVAKNEEMKASLGPKAKIPNLMFNLENSIPLRGNEVDLLINMEAKWPKLLEDIQAAKQFIHIEYYIYSLDELGNKLLDLLYQKVQEGVQVRFIYDDVGSTDIKRRDLKKFREKGIEAYPYQPVRFGKLANRVNYRDHRKIVVIDGAVGYIGGINIDRRYLNEPGDQKVFWRDTHLRLQGPSVQALQILFSQQWMMVSDIDLTEDLTLFDDGKHVGEMNVQIVGSAPDNEHHTMMDLYFEAIANAENCLCISTPYFIPNESVLTALYNQARSGVEVKLILPAVSDSAWVQSATLSFVKNLLKHKVRVFLYEKGFSHSKTMVVDDVMSIVGSANMDQRSFDSNAEANAIIWDKGFTQEMNVQMAKDLEDSIELTLDNMHHYITRRYRIMGSIARLIAPLL